MLRKILVDFPFSRDGATIEHAVANKTIDIPDHLVEGLTGLKWIGAPDDTSPAPAAPVTSLVEGGGAPAPATKPASTDADADPAVAAKAAALSAIKIPADFETKHPLSIMSLAKKISGEQAANKAAAIDVIKAELVRRGA